MPAENDAEFLEATFHLHSDRLKEKGYDLHLEHPESTGSLNFDLPARNKRKRFLWAGALATAIAVVSFFVFSSNSSNNSFNEKTAQSEVSTKNGSRTKIQLPDGTSVWLNSNSKLVYDNEHFGAGIREVALTGEAYFDVVKNPAKPFVIHTTKIDIKVLGTAFNVKCYPGEKTTETSLIRGSVEVTLKDRQEKIIMKPSEKLILNNDELKSAKENTTITKQLNAKKSPIIELGHLTIHPKDSAIVETAWVENKLMFSSETLEEVAVKMNRWYGVNIVVTGNKLKKQQLLNGTFEKETVYQALNALQLITPFNYKVTKDQIIISK